MNGMGIYGILANQFALFSVLQLAIGFFLQLCLSRKYFSVFHLVIGFTIFILEYCTSVIDGIPNSFNRYRQRWLEKHFYEHLWKHNTFFLHQINAALVPATLITSALFYFVATILMNENFLSNYQHQSNAKSPSQQQKQEYNIAEPSEAPERIIV